MNYLKKLQSKHKIELKEKIKPCHYFFDVNINKLPIEIKRI